MQCSLLASISQQRSTTGSSPCIRHTIPVSLEWYFRWRDRPICQVCNLYSLYLSYRLIPSRHTLTASDTVAALGPLTYEAIKKYPRGDGQTFSRVHRNINGRKFQLDKKIILFPCKPKYGHKICVIDSNVVFTGQNGIGYSWLLFLNLESEIIDNLFYHWQSAPIRAYVLDSLRDQLSPYSNAIVAGVELFLKAMDVIDHGVTLIAVPLKV